MQHSARLGLVGCGKAGQRYLQALVHLPEATLAATADIDLHSAQSGAVAFDAEAFRDVAEMLRAVELDAVIVAVPSGIHREVVEKALEARVAVLVDPPLALTWEDAQALVRAGARERTRLAVAHSPRLLPTVEEVREAIRAERLGTVVTATAVMAGLKPQSYYDEAPWRGLRDIGGGLAFSDGLTALDALVHLLGPVEEVFAHSSHHVHRRAVEDALVVSLRFVSEATGSLAMTTAAMKGQVEERLAVYGTAGVVSLGPTLQIVERWRVEGDDEDQVRRRFLDMPARTSWQGQWDALHDFVSSVLAGASTALDVANALETVAAGEAIERALAEKRAVSLAEVREVLPQFRNLV